jgi:hypothetical protein
MSMNMAGVIRMQRINIKMTALKNKINVHDSKAYEGYELEIESFLPRNYHEGMFAASHINRSTQREKGGTTIARLLSPY